MVIMMGEKAYKANQKGVRQFLQLASELTPVGIYAVQKGDQIDLIQDKCTSKTQLKRMIRQYRALGYKVYYNGR